MSPEQWSTIRHFTPQEFACRDDQGDPCPHCGGRERMAYSFMLQLDAARELFGEPITVTSGSRCQARNIEVGGSNESSHLFDWQDEEGRECEAADLLDYQNPVYRWRLFEALRGAGFSQIEVSRDGHMHVARDARKPFDFLGIEP
jgi:hypothetical protein